MHEVEVKAGLKDKDAVVAKLQELGCSLGPEIVQDDTIYAREIESLARWMSNTDFLRLRVEDSGRTLFTFKHHPGRATDLSSAPLELELEVQSRETMERILHLMGYQEGTRVRKHRRKGSYENWEICVDDVEGLGTFLEIEELVGADADVNAVQERMRAFMAELGISSADQHADRYDILLLRKQ